MSKILMLKGLPASGKTTYAKELVNRGGWKRINKDDLRSMLDNGKWSKGNESFIIRVRDLLIYQALSGGQYSVVIDDTNFAPQHEQVLKAIADNFKIPFEVKFFNTPLQECLQRDLNRTPNNVGTKVIIDMYNQYLKPPAKVIKYDPKLPTAILCDIDGTLAHGIGVTRKPYEWDKVGSDTLDSTIADLIGNTRHSVILMSGRDGSCQAETIKWLSDNRVRYDYLYMREAGDNRKDSIVKKELYEEHIEGKWNIEYVLDDRNQVVDMWRSLGLKVFQVADGSF